MRPPSPQRIGRYRLIRRIGRGGSGDVYLARLEAGGGVHRLAAVKILLHTVNDPRHHAALLAEARLGALLSHPNIAQVLDAGVEDGLSWFAMEFVPGLSFFELMEAAGGPIPPWIAARLVADACAAVHALHDAADEQGKALDVVHRDVTPHNLLVSWDGNVKLVDLGVARSALRGSVTKTGVVKGKLGYMSPEQASGAAVDRRCDVFALGVQLWEALAGRRLFKQHTDSETLASIVRGDIPSLRDAAGIPASLADVAAGALRIDPTARFSTALEMQRALDGALGAAGAVIGSCEVARLLAHAAPERVREHIRWLREATDGPSGPTPEASPPPPSASGKHVSARRKRRSFRLTLGVLVAGSVAATALMMVRPAIDRSRHPQGEAIASEWPPADRERIVTPPIEPAPSARPPALPAGPALPGKTRKPAPIRSTPRRPPPEPAGTGTLYVNASPTWATINLDGKPAGTTPTVVSNLAAGSHIVVATPLGKGPPVQRKVVVEAGGTARMGFEFEEP